MARYIFKNKNDSLGIHCGNIKVLRPKIIFTGVNENGKPTRKQRILRATNYFIMTLAALIFFVTIWLLRVFAGVTFDAMLFQIYVPLNGVNINLVASFTLQCIIPALSVTFICAVILKRLNGKLCLVKFQTAKKNVEINLTPNRIIRKIILFITPVILLTGSVYFFFLCYDIESFFSNHNATSTFIDKNYIDPRAVDITFPEKKRNLIFIFLESMETTFLSSDLGGALAQNAIPELAELAIYNKSFSNKDTLGGAVQLTGTGWTIAAMVSQHSGIPLKIPIDGDSYGENEPFLPGLYTLGDILNSAGYNQTLMVGSDAGFGCRREFFSQHGEHKILDLFTAADDGIIEPDYKVWWGFEDQKLFEYAKEELTALSDEAEPFSFVMLTVDTHFADGYKCPLCKDEFEEQLWNVIACSSRQVNGFVEWLSEQDFYENTTVVISGDHLSMDSIVLDQVDEDYQRTTFNVFINSMADTNNNKNRLFSSMDMFPSTLASMGVSIEGERLGLGTNLFSDTPTLLELYGIDLMNDELGKRSELYNAFLANEYIDGD